MHPSLLLGVTQQAVLDRAGIDPEVVGQVVCGCIGQIGAQSANVARNAWLTAGLPLSVAATTVDSQCGSSQQAAGLAASLIASGAIDTALACGVESMSMIPIGAATKAGPGRALTRHYFAHYEFLTQFQGPSASPNSGSSPGKNSTGSASRASAGPTPPGPPATSTGRSSRSTPPSSATTANPPARPSTSPATRGSGKRASTRCRR